MAERSFEEAYDILLQAMRDKGLNWAVEQVQAQVRAGKPAIKSVRPIPSMLGADFVDEVDVARQRQERLAATEDYTPSERLSLAIDAIEHAVAHTAEIEADVLEFARNASGMAPGVRFEPDAYEEATAHELSHVEQRLEEVGRLKHALAELRARTRQ